MDILIVGSIAFDSITTPFAQADDILGGSATYFSLAASYFASPGVVAVVGEDFGQEHKKILLDKKIDLEGLEQLPGKTFRWAGKYDFDLNSRTTLFTHLNVLEHFQPKIPSSYQNQEYIFLGNIHPSLQQNVLKQIPKPKFVGLDTMNFWIEKTPRELAAVLKNVDALVINDSEARQLTGQSNIHKAAKAILNSMDETKNPLLVIKRGEYGLIMFQGSNFFALPAFPLEDVFDPTGAGDSFAGAFMGYLAATQDLSWENLKRACVAGSSLASFCVEKMGVEKLLNLSMENIKQRSEKFKLVTKF